MTDTEAAQKAAMTGQRSRVPLTRRIMEATGNKWGGGIANPPLSNHGVYVKDDGLIRVFSMQDDGGFVGIGYPNEWHVIMRTKAARLFAWWTFKMWVVDWFGLRSWAYYVALHKDVRGGRWRLWYPYARRTRALTRWSSYEEWQASEEGREWRAYSRAQAAGREVSESDGS